MMRKSTFLSLMLCCGSIVACKENPRAAKEVVTAPVEFKKEAEIYLTKPGGDTIQHLEVEIADDDYQRETGLMYRKSMLKNRGMLFIFDNEEQRGFYMKNTEIPLDLIFLNSQNKIVSISKNARPKDLQTIPSGVPAQYVLEVNAGLVDEWDLAVGDSLILNRN